ncbi:MAG TPA: 4-vinyl reductase [Gemmatimonadales bacterium]|jgi:predicted hydrocarbon binding protein|nr:4-vinyl reductase [Gemmatimonadales bacterium]
MTDTFRPGRFGLTLSPRVLQQLRASLERDAGLQAATYLQEAGFAGGEGLYAAFSAWLAGAYGVDRPADLDSRYLGEALSAFLAELGWGSVSVTPVSGSALALDSVDWAEAQNETRGEYPSCHLTCGLLADFLGRISEGLVAVMEVECRSRGDSRCRFLAGSPETLGTLYDRMAQGMSYNAALGAAGAGTPA